MSRIKFLTIFVIFMLVSSACAAETPAEAPAEAEVAIDSLQLGESKDVAREGTLTMAWSMNSPIGVTSP